MKDEHITLKDDNGEIEDFSVKPNNNTQVLIASPGKINEEGKNLLKFLF